MAKKDITYWKERCMAAEKVIECPKDRPFTWHRIYEEWEFIKEKK